MKAVKITAKDLAKILDISPRQVQKRMLTGNYWPFVLEVKRGGYKWNIWVLKSWYDSNVNQ
jgi:hypothetical protein